MLEMGLQPARITSDEVFALCPGHDDHTPNSWSVNRETGNHYCFSCGFKGSFVGLVVRQLKLDPFTASRWVRTHGVELMDVADLPTYAEAVATRGRKTRKVGEVLGESALALFYRPPWQHLELREITMDACDYYDVLWDIERAGWILPIRTPRGELLGWQYKSKRLFDNYPVAVPKSTCLFGWDTIQETVDTAILVESPLDCLRMLSAGVDPTQYAALSSYGSEVSDEQMRLLVTRFGTVILAMDNDSAGKKITARLLHGTVEFKGKKQIKSDGWMSRINLLVYNYGTSKGKDPGDQTDAEILWSLSNSIPGVKSGLTRVKVGLGGLSRNSQTLSRKSRQPRARPQTGTRRIPNGFGKIGNCDLRRRGNG